MPDTFEKSAAHKFTPASLEHLPSPPTFRLRAGGYRERRAVRSRLIVDGLVSHSPEAFRAELLKALAHLWDAETFAQQEPRLQAFWTAADEHEKAAGEDPNAPPFEHLDAEAMAELTSRVASDWEPLRRMMADVMTFQAESPIILLATLCDGWSNLDAQFRRDDRHIGSASMDALESVEAALLEIEQNYSSPDDEAIIPGLAWAQLLLEAGRLMYASRPGRVRAA